jgi:hypothetical protein
MEVSTETLVEILREVEADDPIDYADLPFGEQELRLRWWMCRTGRLQ